MRLAARATLRSIVLLPLAIASIAASAGAQAAPLVRLDRPDATLAEEFSLVRGVRELSDGRLIIADWIEDRVVVADLATGAVRQVIRAGPGPQEARLPAGLVRLRGDTTLLLDEGNNRLMLLGPDGRAIRSILAEAPGRLGVRGIDASGALLHAIPSWAEGPNALPDDSVRVVRWEQSSDGAPRVLAVVQGTRYRKDRSPAMQPRMPMVGFAEQDAWVVLPSGALAVVRARPYRVEVRAAGRAPVTGPAYESRTRAVTLDDKKRFVRQFAAGSPVSGRGADGGMGRASMIDEAEVTRMVGTAEWAERLPPFDPSRVLAANSGETWVGMTAEPGRPVRYDVFDERGVRVRQVELRAGRRVAAVGARGVYVVADDEDGVQTIERYRMP